MVFRQYCLPLNHRQYHRYPIAKENYCFFPVVGFCLNFCIKDFCFEFLLFLSFSKDSDLRPALWRHSLYFSFLVIFSWSSVLLSEGLRLIIFTSQNWLASLLTCQYYKQTKNQKYWMYHQSLKFLRTYYRHCSSGYYYWETYF